jgi:transcriptional regulator with XRE-family HTH domain
MESTAENLARKNQDGVTLLLKLLSKLGMPYRELARKLGVSAPMVTYWAQHKQRMSPADQTKVYGIFAEAVTQRWPEDDAHKQRQLLPLMEQLITTWQEATEMEKALNAEAEDTHLKASIPLVQHKVKSIEEWYAFEKAHDNFLAFREAQYELAMTQDAWDKANEVIAKAKKVLTEDTPPPRKQRGPRRRSQRKRRAGSRTSS